MRVALICPYSTGPMRGNIITVQRIARFLGQAGVATVILPADSLSVMEMERRLAEFSPDLIHGIHARYSGVITRHVAERLHLPYLITITGSDIYDPVQRDHPDTALALGSARAVACFDDRAARMLADCFPGSRGKVAIVPQGVEQLPVLESGSFGLAPDDFVLLLPAALRPVKQVEFPLQALSSLVDRLPTVRLVIAGGVLDQDYGATIRSMLCDAPFAVWLGEVPHEKMGSLYCRADVVLNCSLSESMPNSLLEAMALGRPVLATDIPGNRSLVRDRETGWLFHGESDFRRLVLHLAADVALRGECGHRAREYVLDHFSPRQEADRYMALYGEMI